jgi:hypothetical protein
MTVPTLDLREAVAGRVERWQWQPGLGPEAVGEALGAVLSPAEHRHQGRLRRATSIQLSSHRWPLWALWDETGELVLIEVPEPPAAPTGAEALASFGEADARIDRTRGPYPGNEQLCYLSRGFTLFAWGDSPPAYLWLYRPTDFEAYVADLGATMTPTRGRR